VRARPRLGSRPGDVRLRNGGAQRPTPVVGRPDRDDEPPAAAQRIGDLGAGTWSSRSLAARNSSPEASNHASTSARWPRRPRTAGPAKSYPRSVSPKLEPRSPTAHAKRLPPPGPVRRCRLACQLAHRRSTRTARPATLPREARPAQRKPRTFARSPARDRSGSRHRCGRVRALRPPQP
jgi:hypothetical protein